MKRLITRVTRVTSQVTGGSNAKVALRADSSSTAATVAAVYIFLL
jgi:hypothetical protein